MNQNLTGSVLVVLDAIEDGNDCGYQLRERETHDCESLAEKRNKNLITGIGDGIDGT